MCEEINNAFEGGGDFDSIPGVLMHQWDFEDPAARWRPQRYPSPKGCQICAPYDDRVSTQIQNKRVSIQNGVIKIRTSLKESYDPSLASYLPGGVILSPNHTNIMCAYASDGEIFDRLGNGCGCHNHSAKEGWCHNNSCASPFKNSSLQCAWPAHKLSAMLEQMERLKSSCNEVLVSPKAWIGGLPGTILAFWYPVNTTECNEACVKEVSTGYH
jgi:hypothetical protein